MNLDVKDDATDHDLRGNSDVRRGSALPFTSEFPLTSGSAEFSLALSEEMLQTLM